MFQDKIQLDKVSIGSGAKSEVREVGCRVRDTSWKGDLVLLSLKTFGHI